MTNVSLLQIAMLLAAAAVAAPLARVLKIGSVLGYLLAGIALGPYGLGGAFSIYEAKEILHVAEFGVVMLLFLIGLELKPRRLWSMRSAIFGAGAFQVVATAAAIAVLGDVLSMSLQSALFVGLTLSLSSTAFALQVLEENRELTMRHGRLAFAILLFQDLAAIPLIALAPLFAASMAKSGPLVDALAIGKALGVIAAVVIVGRFALDPIFSLISRARVPEAMTAAALLIVVGVTLVMQAAGLSASLGAFIAGALLAESTYRHQLEADLQPFQGLLLGLFFTTIGMSLNLGLVLQKPMLMLALVVALVGIKAIVLYAIGRMQGLDSWGARRLGLSLSQGGEFAFILFAVGAAAGVLGQGQAEVFAVIVTLSMAATPLLLLADASLFKKPVEPARAFEPMPDASGHVIIAGFGRFGQVAARILRAKQIPFTALDISPDQIAMVTRFGAKAFYGDASRMDILEAAKANEARALVLAIDDVEASLRTAAMVKDRYPELAIYARARNRNHAHRLMDLGIKVVRRETFLSSLDLSFELLKGLGYSTKEARRVVQIFKTHDERRLEEDYKDWSNEEKLRDKARSDAATLERLFAEDAAEQAIADGDASPRPRNRSAKGAVGVPAARQTDNKETSS